MNPLSEPFGLLEGALRSAGIRFAIGGSWASTAYGESRLTNDVDLVADLNLADLDRLLSALPRDFYVDREEARAAVAAGRPFNIICMPTVFKFDLFPARAYPLGAAELDRAVTLTGTGLSPGPLPYVSPEDIVLAKLSWFREGGEVSDRQWRDILSILQNRAAALDRAYLEEGAGKLGVSRLLDRAMKGAGI